MRAARSLAGPDGDDEEARRALRVVLAHDSEGTGCLGEFGVLPALRDLLGDLVQQKALKLGPISAECKRVVPPDTFGRIDRTQFVRWWLRSEWAALVREQRGASEPKPAAASDGSGGSRPQSARSVREERASAASSAAWRELAVVHPGHSGTAAFEGLSARRDDEFREWGQSESGDDE